MCILRVISWIGQEELEIQVSRSVKVGRTVRINPSMAYLGIESGLVEVVAIVPGRPDKDAVYTADIHTENIIRDMEEFKRVEAHGLYDEDWVGEMNRLEDQPWIVYWYNNSDDIE